ncbi:MAG TPA: ribosome small subunit-dependent GTPase A [Gammaproteobacteria bacterium]
MTSLASLGFDEFFAAQLRRLDPAWVPARIASEGRNTFRLLGCRAEIGELTGRLRRSLAPEERPVCGDWVAVADGEERAVIHHVLDRRTALVRRAPGREDARPQVLAANVDVFFVVTSANQDLNERRLERYLAAVWNSGASPVIVLNKVDLVKDPAPLLGAIERVALGVPVLQASAKSGVGLEALRGYLAPGRTVAFVGSSGVGKSSLANRLLGREVQQVGELRADERGRHTTTARQLMELPHGGLLIDTPGLRELGLIDDAGGLDVSFPDVAAFAEQCRFRDCRHAGEPGCAVVEAVERGELAPERLASYRKLVEELEAAERRRDPAEAAKARQRWKVIHKGLRARAKIDPKLKR